MTRVEVSNAAVGLALSGRNESDFVGLRVGGGLTLAIGSRLSRSAHHRCEWAIGSRIDYDLELHQKTGPTALRLVFRQQTVSELQLTASSVTSFSTQEHFFTENMLGRNLIAGCFAELKMANFLPPACGAYCDQQPGSSDIYSCCGL